MQHGGWHFRQPNEEQGSRPRPTTLGRGRLFLSDRAGCLLLPALAPLARPVCCRGETPAAGGGQADTVIRDRWGMSSRKSQAGRVTVQQVPPSGVPVKIKREP